MDQDARWTQAAAQTPAITAAIADASATAGSRVRRRATVTALKVALAYLLVGALWIVTSTGWLNAVAARMPLDSGRIELFKGLFFVFATAAALFGLLRYGFLRWHQVELRVRAADHLMRTVAETMPDALVLVREDGRIGYLNAPACRLFGRSRGELVGVAFDAGQWEISAPDGGVFAHEDLPFVVVRRDLRPVHDVLHAIRTPHLGRLVVSVSASPLLDDMGRFAGMVATVRDATEPWERQRIEAMRARVLAAMSAVSVAALRAQSTQELCEAACAALVDQQVCVLVWVGRVQVDPRRSVVPLASAGLERDYVESLDVRWDHSARGAGPAGRAIRTRQPVACDDTDTDPSFAQWREWAAAHGLASAFCLPLVGLAGVPDVVICGYSRAPRAYTAGDILPVLKDFSRQFGIALELAQRRVQREAGAQHARDVLSGALFAMQRLVEMRDPYTHGHEERVARLAVAIADELGFPPSQREALEIAAKLHDIGKVSVPSEILSKPVRLTETEYALVKGHVDAGYRILEPVDFGGMPIAEIVRQHHERLDGSGYPRGLQGDGVMLEARVLAVADVAESMLSHRPYRAALGDEHLRAELEAGRGLRYDAEVVDACLKVLASPGSPLAQRSTNARSNT